MLAAGELDAQADVTAIWAALNGYARDPETGLYPVRQPDDPTLGLAIYLQAAAVREGLRRSLRVAVTTSKRDQAPKWQAVAEETGDALTVKTIDPGREVAAARLAASTGGTLSSACETALGRWY